MKVHSSMAMVALLVVAGGCGGTLDVDKEVGLEAAGPGGQGSVPDPSSDFKKCMAVSAAAKPVYRPVDIVFTIDNTPSMHDEIEQLRANLNAFSQKIMSTGIDVRIVLNSCLEGQCDHWNWYGICVGPPLGKACACEAAADDSNPPHYLHVNQSIPSHKGLNRTILTYQSWKSMLRKDSIKHLVSITDDNDEWSAAAFRSALLALDPGLTGYKHHGIYSYLSKEDACAISGSEPCCKIAPPGGEGTVIRELVQMTGGVSGDLCLQNFAPVLDHVATSVITGSRIACSWELPDPPIGMILDTEKINVSFIDSGTVTELGRASSLQHCSQVKDGWYYDDPVNPTEVRACPQTCSWMQDKSDGKVSIRFGCKTELATPD